MVLSSLVNHCSGLPKINHVTEDHVQGGRNCLYTHFGGAKALFSFINLQVNDSVGGAKPCKIVHLEAITPCRFIPAQNTVILGAFSLIQRESNCFCKYSNKLFLRICLQLALVWWKVIL